MKYLCCYGYRWTGCCSCTAEVGDWNSVEDCRGWRLREDVWLGACLCCLGFSCLQWRRSEINYSTGYRVLNNSTNACCSHIKLPFQITGILCARIFYELRLSFSITRYIILVKLAESEVLGLARFPLGLARQIILPGHHHLDLLLLLLILKQLWGLIYKTS